MAWVCASTVKLLYTVIGRTWLGSCLPECRQGRDERDP